MATEIQIEAAAKAIWLVSKSHDQFAPSWETASHDDKVFAYAFAKVALEAAERIDG